MKKLLVKDKKLREKFSKIESQSFVLKSIFKNTNFFPLIRWNAYLKLTNLVSASNKTKFSNRCLQTINKKRLHKSVNYSRQILLKLVRSGKISNLRKSSW